MQARLLETLSRIAGVVSTADLAAMIDHTLLKPTATLQDALRIVEEASRYGFHCAMLPPHLVREVSSYASEYGVRLCTVVGFPAGFQPVESKLAEIDAVAGLVEEIDVVAPLWAGAVGDIDAARSELSRIVDAARAVGVRVVKVIVEAPLLDDNALKVLVEASREASAEYVKTSTGVYSKGGDPYTVMRLHALAEPLGLKVKAAGGIRNGIDALLAIASGATRIGTSRGVEVVESYRKLKGEQ